MIKIISLFFLVSSAFASNCYENRITNVELKRESKELFALISFRSFINESRDHLFKRSKCSRFYDSLICTFESKDLPGWVIESDSDIEENWRILKCPKF